MTQTPKEKYTHVINKGYDNGVHCMVYNYVEKNKDGQVYIRTSDGRCYWINENNIEVLTELNKM